MEPNELTMADVIGKQKESYSQYKEELRDHFAGLAMSAHITADVNDTCPPDQIAEIAYRQADAMIRAREAGQ